MAGRTWHSLAGSGLMVVACALLQNSCGGNPTGTTGGGGNGTIDFNVTGLPVGAVARILVAGPDNAVHNVGAATELTGLADGQYTVSGLHVPSGGQDYTAVASPSVVTVSGETPVSSTITYSAHALPTVDFTISGFRLFQSVQRADGSVPMVAGRSILMQVYGKANQANANQVKVRVHIYKSGVLMDSVTVTGPSAVPTVDDFSSLAVSWNVTIPASRVVAGLSLDAVIDPSDQFSEASESNNRFPAGSANYAPGIVTVPTVKLTLVPVHQTGGTGSVSVSTAGNYTDLAHRLYPISTLSTTVHVAFSTQAPELQNGDQNGAWGQILSEINALRVSDHSNATYYGVVHPSYNSGVAGLGYVGAPAAIGWDKGSGVGEVAAHELGHTFGRQHAPCGNPSNPDPSYPYDGALIGVWGYDPASNQLQNPSTTVDLMSYCSPDWVSDYNYMAVLEWLTGGASVRSETVQSGLLVWGRIIGDSLVLEPAFQVTAPASLPRTSGPYRVTGTAADGSTTFDLRFAGDLVPDLPGRPERHFAFVIPMDEVRAAGLASIRLAGPGQRFAEVRALAATGEAQVRRSGGDEMEVTWDRRAPMAVIRDAASGEILAFGRGGKATVATAGDVQVELSRGTHSQRVQLRKRP